ncbi:Eco57I restriction-modification methylase domain-containing protein [Ciceribacter selenitireducens]
MNIVTAGAATQPVEHLTKDWDRWERVSLYLDRCQVDTPDELVLAAWAHISQLRHTVGKVIDFGAGDGRFAQAGQYGSYTGYEIDGRRCAAAALPANAKLVNACAFSYPIADADVAIGNPPFVRNQDLPSGWRARVAKLLKDRTGVSVSGLANAWQYFFLLSLASLKADGLCVLIVPYEWVSRPSARALREHIIANKWDVSVYRLIDTVFDSVLTTSSITVVDKRSRNGDWQFFEETAEGHYALLPSPSGSSQGVIPYLRRSEASERSPRAIRGLSPGTQKVLTLTEGERVRNGLEIGRDVVACVTSLRQLSNGMAELTEAVFRSCYRNAGEKCWLIRTDSLPSEALVAYLESVPKADYQTSTCLEREIWWKFKMPPVPEVLIAQSFKGRFPKAVKNVISARAVGGVSGVYGLDDDQSRTLCGGLDDVDIRERVVAHSNGLRKIEVNQLNALLNDAFANQ